MTRSAVATITWLAVLGTASGGAGAAPGHLDPGASARAGVPATTAGANAATPLGTPASAGAPGFRAVPPPAGAHTELVGRSTRADGTERLRYRYGPLSAAPGQNLTLVGPVAIEKPALDGYVTHVVPGLERTDGSIPPVERVHMHHAVFFNLARRDRAVPDWPERFFGFAEEKTRGQFPDGFGYPIRASDTFAIAYMLHNGTPDTEVVWITYEIDFVPAVSPAAAGMRAAHPLWLDVENAKAYPVFDVRRGSGTRGRYTYPDDARPDPYRGGPARNEWTVDRDSILVATAGHLHPGGLWTDLEVERGSSERLLFRSEARYFDPNGPVSWDLAMTVSPPNWRIAVRRGDVLSVKTVYETERASWYESMGINLVFLADGTDGADPFNDPIETRGDVTHGHLPEADNHGGGPTSIPDPAGLPSGTTLDRRVGIADFLYMPGDLSASGTLQNPPAVDPGQTLLFGNADSSAQIPHTVTACRAPCNRSTGISYPLADGDGDFDSGQLYYYAEGLSGAAQRAEWRTPPELGPGTYTYFCRIHPYMRGSFRVNGETTGDDGGPAGSAAAARRRSATIASRRVRVLRGRLIRIRVGCPAGDPGGCRIAVRLVRRGRLVARGSVRVPSGRTSRATLRLTRHGRALVSRRRAVRVVARATLVGGEAARRGLVVVARRR